MCRYHRCQSRLGSESLMSLAAQGSDSPEAGNCLRIPSEAVQKLDPKALPHGTSFPGRLSAELVCSSSIQSPSEYCAPPSLRRVCMALLIWQRLQQEDGVRAPLASSMSVALINAHFGSMYLLGKSFLRVWLVPYIPRVPYIPPAYTW